MADKLTAKGYTMSISVPAEISAAATVIQFWRTDINPGVWITIFLIVIIVLNLCGVRLYGEVRQIFAYPANNLCN